MTTVGRWSPNKVRARVLDGTWVSTEELGGMVLLTPTSIAYSGTSATVGANGSVEFTGCSSLSLNGVFSVDYDNYMVSVRHVSSTDTALFARYRASGVNADAANYTDQAIDANGASINGFRSTSQTGARYGVMSSSQRGGDTIYVYGPALAQPTASRNVDAGAQSNAYIGDRAATHSLSTAYDGLTLYTGSGTFTGLVSVYGLVGA
jgi:hypothetical protein